MHDRLALWLPHRLADWLTGWPTIRFCGQHSEPVDYLIDRPAVQPTNRLPDRLASGLTEGHSARHTPLLAPPPQGVKPDKLVYAARVALESRGGHVLDSTPISGVQVHTNGCLVATPSGDVSTRLFVDCMGHGSPAARQLRGGAKPDGVCLVVGSCCSGFAPEANTTADVIYTNTHVQAGTGNVQDV